MSMWTQRGSQIEKLISFSISSDPRSQQFMREKKNTISLLRATPSTSSTTAWAKNIGMEIGPPFFTYQHSVHAFVYNPNILR